jgi:hypothetical protein
VSMRITVQRSDGTSFIGVSEGSIGQEGTGQGATVVFPGTGWVLVSGVGPKVRSGQVQASATGSEILLQNFPASGIKPSTTRVLLVEASAGGTVAALDGSTQRSLSAGQYIDVENGDPVEIGMPQQYNGGSMGDTADALAAAQTALSAQDSED